MDIRKFIVVLVLLFCVWFCVGCGEAPDEAINLSRAGEETTTFVVEKMRFRIFPEEMPCHGTFSVSVFSYENTGKNAVRIIAGGEIGAEADEVLLLFPRHKIRISPSVDGVAYLVYDENGNGCGIIEFVGWIEDGFLNSEDGTIKKLDDWSASWRNPAYFDIARSKKSGDAAKAAKLYSAFMTE